MFCSRSLWGATESTPDHKHKQNPNRNIWVCSPLKAPQTHKQTPTNKSCYSKKLYVFQTYPTISDTAWNPMKPHENEWNPMEQYSETQTKTPTKALRTLENVTEKPFLFQTLPPASIFLKSSEPSHPQM